MRREIAFSIDRGCKTFDDGKCVECSNRWFFNKKGYCSPVSNDCRKWDTKSGQCLECYKGY